MTRKLISISIELIDKLKNTYPTLSMNERIEKILDYNVYLQDKVSILVQEKESLQKQEMSQRDQYIKQTNINTEKIKIDITKILEYLIKPNLNDNKPEVVVLPLPEEKEPTPTIKLIYNAPDDVILDQKIIDNVIKSYQDIGGNLVDKKIQDALKEKKLQIFNKSQQPI